MGPLNFVLYTGPVADIIKSHNIQCHFYVDGTQLYVTFKTNCDVDAGLSRSRVEYCVADMRPKNALCCQYLEIFTQFINHSDGITDPKKYKYSNQTLNRPLSVTKAARDCVTLRYNARALRMTCGQLMSPCSLCTSCKSHFCRRATKVRVRNYCHFPHHNF